jgi:hypothetical protein
MVFADHGDVLRQLLGNAMVLDNIADYGDVLRH